MAGPAWRPSRFWQYWALAGMVVLTAAFWWGVEGYAILQTGGPRSQVADGLLRFSVIVLTPAMVVVWFAAAWVRRRIGEAGFWQMLALVAMLWASAVLATRMLIG